MQEVLLAFYSTAWAIAAEQLLAAEGIETKVMALPSVIKAGCGVCLRLAPALFPQAKEALQKNTAIQYAPYLRHVQGTTSWYTTYEGERLYDET